MNEIQEEKIIIKNISICLLITSIKYITAIFIMNEIEGGIPLKENIKNFLSLVNFIELICSVSVELDFFIFFVRGTKTIV